MKVKASRIENGIEICNTCVLPADTPYRYTYINQFGKPETRGCVSECHDVHVRTNTKPNWMAPRYAMPKWITDCRRAMRKAS
jgi:hypothetical protein